MYTLCDLRYVGDKAHSMSAIPKLAGEEDKEYEKLIKDGGKYSPKKKFPKVEEVSAASHPLRDLIV